MHKKTMNLEKREATKEANALPLRPPSCDLSAKMRPERGRPEPSARRRCRP